MNPYPYCDIYFAHPMRNLPKILTISLSLIFLAGCLPVSTPTLTPPADTLVPTFPIEETILLDDFESSTTAWQAGLPPDYLDSSATSLTLSPHNPSQGKQSLAITWQASERGKAIFYLEKDFKLSAKPYLTFTLFAPASLSEVAVAISSGPDWLWQESLTMPVSPGMNTLTFDLLTAYWKVATTDWQPGTALQQLDQVHRIAILLFSNQAGTAYLDQLRIANFPTGQQVALAEPVTPEPATQLRSASYLELLPITQSASAYEKLEFAIQTDGSYANPFDPAEIDIRIHFTDPTGAVTTVPAFWYQDYDPVTLQTLGNPGWRVRFTPTQPGSWQAQAEVSESALKSAPVTLQVAPANPASPNAQGFIRIHPQNPRYLAIENGATWFPIGLNMGWGSGNQLADYERWLDRLAQNQGNVIRIWMASWSFGLEWNDTGLRNYTQRLERAFWLDRVFQMAEQRAIKIELVLINHGAFSATTNPQWQESPYNQANGGMCPEPACFATNPTAQAYFKSRLRYIAARYAYSPALFAWEWWNEAEWTPITDPQMIDWITTMTPVLKEFDPYHHLISTSYAMSSRPAINNLPDIDFAQVHLYDSSDPLLNFPDLYQGWSKDIPGKPILFGEFGASAGGENDKSADQQGLHLHNALWAATFSGFTSTALYWWWDSYVDPLNLWPQYRHLATFLQGIDLATLQPSRFRVSDLNVPHLVMKNDTQAIVYLHDRKYSFTHLQAQYDRLFLLGKKPGPGWFYRPESLSGLSLTVRDLRDGNYLVKFFDPTQGEWLTGSTTLSISGGQATLTLPDFTGDLAIKIDVIP